MQMTIHAHFLFYASLHLWLNSFSFNKGCTGICKGEENVQWTSRLSKHKHSCTDLGPAFVVEVEELPLVDDVAIFLTQLEHLKTKSMMRVIDHSMQYNTQFFTVVARLDSSSDILCRCTLEGMLPSNARLDVVFPRKDITQPQKKRPESPTVTLTWHMCKYTLHKLHQKYILNP